MCGIIYEYCVYWKVSSFLVAIVVNSYPFHFLEYSKVMLGKNQSEGFFEDKVSYAMCALFVDAIRNMAKKKMQKAS